eukprot:40102-Amphidinium_carterae.1
MQLLLEAWPPLLAFGAYMHNTSAGMLLGAPSELQAHYLYKLQCLPLENKTCDMATSLRAKDVKGQKACLRKTLFATTKAKSSEKSTGTSPARAQTCPSRKVYQKDW